MDSEAQQLMALSAFPCPPLPQYVMRAESTETDVVSSHDLISCGMINNRRLGYRALQSQVEKKMALLQTYNDKIDALYKEYKAVGGSDVVGTAYVKERMYTIFQDFTRSSLAIYMDKTSAGVDAVYAPLDTVDKGSPVHRQACRHLVLHSMITGEHEEEHVLDIKEAAKVPYTELLYKFFVTYCKQGEKEQAMRKDANTEHEDIELSTGGLESLFAQCAATGSTEVQQ